MIWDGGAVGAYAWLFDGVPTAAACSSSSEGGELRKVRGICEMAICCLFDFLVLGLAGASEAGSEFCEFCEGPAPSRLRGIAGPSMSSTWGVPRASLMSCCDAASSSMVGAVDPTRQPHSAGLSPLLSGRS